ncbi:MAG: hypothetical protein GF393_08545 [Armatimonadia bacterium]|nr:hypothetical protein [Armatimonadia bacterium]
MLSNRRIVFVYVVALIALATVAAQAFPLNGDFERSYRGTPFGWEETGAWSYYPIRSFEGRGHFMLNERFARPGAELLSRGFRLFSTGETLSLSCAYRSSGPGASIGLIFCDALGRPLGERWDVPLPPSEDWSEFETSFQMDALSRPEDAAAVRVCVLVDVEAIEVHVDAIRLEGGLGHPSGTLLPVPPQVPSWQTRDLLGPVDGEVEIEPIRCMPDSDETLTELWLSDPMTVVGTFPHRAVAGVEISSDSSARAAVLLRALGAARSEVLWQEMQAVPLDGEGLVTVELPAPFIRPRLMRLQVGLALEAESPAAARLVDCEVHRVPLSVDVNGVQRKTVFDAPEDVEVFVSAINNVGAELETEAVITVHDAAGNKMHGERRTIRIRGRSAASFSVKPGLRSAGDYTFLVRFFRQGLQIGAGEFDFVVEGPV